MGCYISLFNLAITFSGTISFPDQPSSSNINQQPQKASQAVKRLAIEDEPTFEPFAYSISNESEEIRFWQISIMTTLTTTSILHDPPIKWSDTDHRVWFEEAEKPHRELSWRGCEKFHQELREEGSEKESPLRVSECEYHWKLKTEEVKPPSHERHAEYPLWACECPWHLVEQAKEEKWSRVCQEHPCHGFYGCDIKNCDKCNQSDMEEKEEDMTDICDPKHPKHGSVNWTFCRDDGCLMHKSEKDGAAYWPKRREQKKRQSRHTECL